MQGAGQGRDEAAPPPTPWPEQTLFSLPFGNKSSKSPRLYSEPRGLRSPPACSPLCSLLSWRVLCHVPTGLWPHFTDKGMRSEEASVPTRSPPARIQPPALEGGSVPLACPVLASVPDNPPQLGGGSPHLPGQGPIGSQRNTGHRFSTAPGTSSPFHPAPPLPRSLITVSLMPRSHLKSQEPDVVLDSPSFPHLSPRPSSFPSEVSATLSLPQHKPHSSLLFLQGPQCRSCPCGTASTPGQRALSKTHITRQP